MKIRDLSTLVVEVNQRGDWVFVQIQTDSGLVGLGEASHSGSDRLLLAVVAHFREQLLGADPTQIGAIRQQLLRPDSGRIGQTALSAIEQALWDLLGQQLGVPIHQLLGGALRDRLRLYANINRHVTDRSPAGFARAAQQAVAEGFTAIKLAPFDELRAPNHVRTGPQAAWRTGVARVEAVRAAIGDTIELAVDCHSRMDASEAITVSAALAHCDLFWYEEPVHHSHTAELARVSQAVPMPTASGESVFGLAGFRPFLTERVVDVLMPDVKHDGGLLETQQIAAAAGMAGLLVAPHNPSGPVAGAASAQVCATLENFYILEHAWGEVPWRAELLTPPERIEDGDLILSPEPGLGHRLNMEQVQRHLRQGAGSGDSSKVQTDV